MVAIALSRLAVRTRLRDIMVSAVAIAALSGLLLALKPLLAGAGHANLLLFFVVGVSGMVVIGVPIMTAFGLSTVGFLTFATDIPSMVAVGRIDEGMSGLILLSVPLFVFLGALIEATGMAAAMIRVMASLIGHVRGGLSYVLIGAMYLVSGISGSKAADMAAVAPALFPDMKQRGEDEGELVAMLSSSGAMSETIPPSLVRITIGSVTGISIAALFTDGFMPAVVGAIAMAIVVWLKNRRRVAAVEVARASRREVVRPLVYALPAAALPFLIRAAVVGGIATATEVATLGVACTFIVGLTVYRRFDWKRLYPMLIDTASVGSDPAHHRLCNFDGVGVDAIRVVARSGQRDGRAAGRCGQFHAGFGGGVRGVGQLPRRHSCDRALRTAPVPDRPRGGHPRGALRDGGRVRGGTGSVRAAVRCGLLRRLRDRQSPADGRHVARMALSGSLVRRASGDRGRTLDFDRLLVMAVARPAR